MDNLRLLAPEITLAVFSLLLLGFDLLLPGKRARALHHLGVLAAAVTLGVVGLAYSNPEDYQGVGTLWAVDPLSLFFKVLVLVTAILVLILSMEYKPKSDHAHIGTYASLILFAALGMMLLVSATDFLLIFLSLELVSLSSFILVGYERSRVQSSEGAVKYFLIGAFSSAFMVYGISLFYGAVGSTKLLALQPMFDERSLMFVTACLLITVGFGFKISLVPFHLWVPDAYEGAPTPVTAYLSIAPKIAGLAVMLRVFTVLVPHGTIGLTGTFAFLAVLTMSVGNLTALFQTNVKRLLAYSSIAQAGYILIGFVTADALGREGVLFYSLVYLFMNIGAFAAAIAIGNETGYEFHNFNGLAKRNFGLALMMAFFLLSLAGIPPLAGFVAKFYLFAAAVKGEFYWLAVFAVLNSVVSVYYYMRLSYHMFFQEPETLEPVEVGPFLFSTLTVATVAIFLIGLYPEPFLAAVRLSAEILPNTPAALLSARH